MLHVEAKRLSSSDLSAFAWHLHNHDKWPSTASGGNQKALNPSKGVLEGAFPQIAVPDGWRRGGDVQPPPVWPDGEPGFDDLAMTILGPASAPAHREDCRLTFSSGNWRINARIQGPREDPKRYDQLLPNDDWALIGFEGVSSPERIILVLLDADDADDAALIAELAQHGSSTAVETDLLEEIVTRVDPDPGHGVYVLLGEDPEAVATAGTPPPLGGKSLLDMPVYAGRLTPQDFDALRHQLAKDGALGERFVDSFLSSLLSAGELPPYEWSSRERPDGPYDFHIDPEGSPVRVEVKATRGGFSTGFYLSINEVKAGLEASAYEIFRVYLMDDAKQTARLRICRDARELLESLRDALRGLPDGVDATSIRIDPEALEWQPEIELDLG